MNEEQRDNENVKVEMEQRTLFGVDDSFDDDDDDDDESNASAQQEDIEDFELWELPINFIKCIWE